VRRWGSAALDLAYVPPVATMLLERRFEQMGIGSGPLIVREAGAWVEH